jgi:predicted DNA-binding protein (MmcQ/YjbR family)
MKVDAIREFCLTFSGATENLQWGDELCFKVAGKKCAPEVFADLIEREDIRPAPYVGRYKWVMLDRLDAVSWNELQELIRQSYEMVSAKAPKTKSAKTSKKRLKTRLR